MKRLHALAALPLLAALIFATVPAPRLEAQFRADGRAQQGTGAFTVLVGTNPAAGVEISQTVPARELWRVISIATSFVSSATVANRTPAIVFDDGTNEIGRFRPVLLIAASTTVGMTWAQGIAGDTSVVNGASAALPYDAYLSAGSRIRTVTLNLQAGDDYAAPVILFEKFSR